MKKQDIFWSGGLLVTLLVSVLFSPKVLATEQEKTNDFFSVNTNNQDIQPEKHLESTEVGVQSKNLTSSDPEIINITPFSPQQKLNDTEISLNQYSAYQLPENILHTASSCEENRLEDSAPILVTTNNIPSVEEDLKRHTFGCEYSANKTYYNTPDQDLNINNTNSFHLYKPNYNTTLSVETLIAQETNNQQQAQLTPVEPNLPIVPKEVPSLPIPDDKPETKPEEKPALAPEQNKQVLRILMRSLLENSASRYPFFVNTSDKLIINPRNFQPLKFTFYSNFGVDLDNFDPGNAFQKEQFSDPLIKSANISIYPDDEQFYWVLDGNRVVIETQGNHLNFGYQGNSYQQKLRQFAQVSTAFSGVQTVFAFPTTLTDSVGSNKLNDLNVTIATAEIVLPPGVQLPDNASFNLNITGSDGSLFQKLIPLANAPKATTDQLLGGGALSGNLDARNAPKFFQGFQTVNLQPLLNNGVKLEAGSIIPRENLLAAGLTLGDFFTNQGYSFKAPITSLPGIKTLQVNQINNNDLFEVLSNPFLTKEQRDFHYLNSLSWSNLGQQSPEVTTSSILAPQNQAWYRYTLSWSHNRTLLQYDPEKIRLNYLNVFANPGLSVTTAQWQDTDLNQTTNASLGLILGSAFSVINPGNLNASINEAKEQFNTVKTLATLKTKATSQQRRQMNERLNNTLSYGNTNSSLAQVSGSYTFSGNITSDSSLLLQLRTGIYQRSVQFIEQIIQPWTDETPVVIDSVSLDDLGPMFSNIPKTNANAPQTITYTFLQAKTSDGQVLFDKSFVLDNNFDSLFTAASIIGGGKIFDINFSRIQLSTSRKREIETSSYTGNLYLPAMEFVISGSIDNLSYSLSTGMWFNLFSDSVPMINQKLAKLNPNATGESSLGGMLKFATKADFRNTFYDKNQQWSTIIVNSPFLSLTYNNNPNRLNLSSLSIGNVFQFVKPDFNITFYPVLSCSPKILNPDVQSTSLDKISTFLLLNFSHRSGFNFNSSFSLGNQEPSYQIESTYDVFKDKELGTVTIGPYYSTYSTATKGFESQLKDPNYGMIFRYASANSGLVMNSRLGKSEDGFRGDMNLEFKF
ncbi:hypothetical protein [Dolichospermum compactum]|uniref:Uncharacterized protein n=1 Tax=Dolichospermum compactum NIES-806 TaxID=1973481 RepID=A0A1Z4UXD7_9CYAN|nr:hypothetical protein [Dolichospermum compactum]BAZ83931.1 hypothetical protein NIES806_01110 [Dolichospermum compactum NIES-806]